MDRTPWHRSRTHRWRSRSRRRRRIVRSGCRRHTRRRGYKPVRRSTRARPRRMPCRCRLSKPRYPCNRRHSTADRRRRTSRRCHRVRSPDRRRRSRRCSSAGRSRRKRRSYSSNHKPLPMRTAEWSLRRRQCLRPGRSSNTRCRPDHMPRRLDSARRSDRTNRVSRRNTRRWRHRNRRRSSWAGPKCSRRESRRQEQTGLGNASIPWRPRVDRRRVIARFQRSRPDAQRVSAGRKQLDRRLCIALRSET